MKPNTLSDWLTYISLTHPKSIAMGLDRVNRVRQALPLTVDFPVIIVGGTNGKGSTCAMLEAMLHDAGYRVGCYTSPHILNYNERLRVNHEPVGDPPLCSAFAEVEAARDDVPLTYFEFGTLAAMLLLLKAKVDVAILEVGLGGRLDAVNIFDPDCAIVTGVDLDHMDYLGDTREKIGYEKAGIFRTGKPAICADSDPPQTMFDCARELGANLIRIGKEFGYTAEQNSWQYWSTQGKRSGLPMPTLQGRYQLSNASACIVALEQLRGRIPVEASAIRSGLLNVKLPGRFQVLPGKPTIILDVAHNPQAARSLSENLGAMGTYKKTYAVFSMLKDKDIRSVIDTVKHRIDHWLIAPVPEGRRADNARLKSDLENAGISSPISEFGSVAAAYMSACKLAGENDRIVAFGSFLTVAEVMRERQRLANATG